jgi:hypothetical protein
MKIRKVVLMGLLASAVALTGCASIVSKSKWPVTIKSDPPGAQVTISDENGKEIHRATTPATIVLHSGAGYFSSANYLVNVKMDGYLEDKGVIKSGLNGWYVGNVVFGGLIGVFIVDPMTGAMWRLPGEYSVSLSKTPSRTRFCPCGRACRGVLLSDPQPHELQPNRSPHAELCLTQGAVARTTPATCRGRRSPNHR